MAVYLSAIDDANKEVADKLEELASRLDDGVARADRGFDLDNPAAAEKAYSLLANTVNEVVSEIRAMVDV
jgi:hypothetical protein